MIIDMSLNASGVRDTARSLHICPNTVPGQAEMDEMWSFVGHKGNPRWLWHAINHCTERVLAYVFGRRQDTVFLKLKALLEPFGITRYSTDYWGPTRVISTPLTTAQANGIRRRSSGSI